MKTGPDLARQASGPLTVEPVKPVDVAGWLSMRERLWADASRDEHLAEMNEQLDNPARFAQFVAKSKDDNPLGFLEASIRTDYVNGTVSTPVAFLEGIFVEPAARRQGVARALITAVVEWATANGCSELASDAAIQNRVSHRVHKSLGFQETERVVYFKRSLEPQKVMGDQSPLMDGVRLFPLDGGLRQHPHVAQWFAQAPTDLRLLAERWFNEFRSCGPDVVELLHDAQPTACVQGIALGYVAAFRAHVNIGFFLGATLPDPSGLLQGTGRFMRHVKVVPGHSADHAAISALISAAYQDLKARLPIGQPR